MADGSSGPSPAELGIPPEDLGIKSDSKNTLPKSQSQQPEALTQPSSDTPIKINSDVPINRENKTAVLIEDEIKKANGKIPYSTFMGISLFGPDGYYSKGKVKIGSPAEVETVDFVTSPESSEFFGATIGIGLAKVWDLMGKPAKFDIVEMGAGQGSLAHGLLKWVRTLRPDFYEVLKYTIVEYGRELVDIQRARNQPWEDKVKWVQGSAYELPLRDIEGAIISNELPDAFPIERVRRINGGVKQLYVSIENNQWVDVWDEPSEDVKKYITEYNLDIQEEVEEPINLNATKLQASVDRALKKGVIITIDYGTNGQVGQKGTLPTRYYGKTEDGQPLRDDSGPFIEYANPGNVDITSDVNFKVLETVAQQDQLKTVFSGKQIDLLKKLGLHSVIDQAKDSWLKADRSWRELRSTYNSFLNAPLLVDDETLGQYYGYLLEKNVDLDPTQIFESDPDPTRDYTRFVSFQPLGIPVNIGRPSEIVYMNPNLKSEELSTLNLLPKRQYLRLVDRNGLMTIDPNTTQHSVIYSGNKEVIYDLRDKDSFDKMLANSGYIS